MPIQLTPEQEQRIQAIVKAGAYPSAREALDAAVAAVEIVAAHDFGGSREELEGLLLEGLESNELPEKEFWDSVDRKTDGMLAAYKSGPPA
jgi:Arc/MetJ-type ribon-helix-helix transcriptional regulator